MVFSSTVLLVLIVIGITLKIWLASIPLVIKVKLDPVSLAWWWAIILRRESRVNINRIIIIKLIIYVYRKIIYVCVCEHVFNLKQSNNIKHILSLSTIMISKSAEITWNRLKESGLWYLMPHYSSTDSWIIQSRMITQWVLHWYIHCTTETTVIQHKKFSSKLSLYYKNSDPIESQNIS